MSDWHAGLLTVDCGNSTLQLFHHTAGARLQLDAAAPDSEQLASFLTANAPRRCVAATVVRDGLDGLRALLHRHGIRLEVAGVDLPCPLPSLYQTPATLGADRWLTALAAHRRFGRSIVVDCGSATTVNLVEQDGTFCGGVIAPGLRAFVVGMANVTPALPAPVLQATPVVPARSSQSAVDTGVLLGYCGLVERLVAETLRASAGPAQVVVTGGNAPRLLALTRCRMAHEPDLVHLGLRLLAGGSR